jgi:hypothetical protein
MGVMHASSLFTHVASMRSCVAVGHVPSLKTQTASRAPRGMDMEGHGEVPPNDCSHPLTHGNGKQRRP